MRGITCNFKDKVTMYLVFDTETTGLPQFNKYRAYHDPKNTQYYDNARILSISWVIVDRVGADGKENASDYPTQTFYIKPDKFKIAPESILIHGITEEIANSKGVPIAVVFDALLKVLPEVTHVVAHNISFDMNVLASECHRYKQSHLATMLKSKHLFCTMAYGKRILGLTKNPKLAELFFYLFGKQIENAHDAKYDTLNCCSCFLALEKLSPTVSLRYDRPLQEVLAVKTTRNNQTLEALDEEQRQIVSAPKGGKGDATLVLACAGSGKTTTIVHRIKYLIDHFQVKEDTIMLTSFTRNAACNMRERLRQVLGHDPNVLVGTFDSLALHTVSAYDSDNTRGFGIHEADVCEYSNIFDLFLKSDLGREFASTIAYLFVDEFQDINDAQFGVIESMHRYGTRIVCVGDDSQSIYAFRGCNVGYICEFTKYFQNASVFNISTNYRCAATIVNVANSSVGCASEGFKIKKTMRPRPNIESIAMKPTVTCFPDKNSQYNHVLKAVLQMLKHGGTSPKTVAVLCPQNRFLYEIEDLLLRHNVPCVMMMDSSAKTASANANDHVYLTTIHKAKGLEWDVVFAIMMVNDLLPMSKMPDDVAEGRRLFYVATTRAKQELHICFAPLHDNQHHQCQMTMYVAELDPNMFIFRGGVQPCHFPAPISNETQSQSQFTRRKKNVFLNSSFTPQLLQKVRSNGGLPAALPITKHKVYSDVPYLDFIDVQDLHCEFDAFVKLFVHRCVCVAFHQPINCNQATELMSTVHLDYLEHIIYTRFAVNFEKGCDAIADIIRHSNVFKKRSSVIDTFLDAGSSDMDAEEMSLVLRILRKMEKITRNTGIPFRDLVIKKQGRRTEDGIFAQLTDAMKVFTDPACSLEEAVWGTWRVAISVRILTCQRRKGIHAKVTMDDLLRYSRLYELITDYFIPQLKKVVGDLPTAQLAMPITHQKSGIQICVDGLFRRDDNLLTLFEIVTRPSVGHESFGETSQSILLESKMRMLSAKYLVEQNSFLDCKVCHILFFDALRGEMTEMDVTSYNGGEALWESVISA